MLKRITAFILATLLASPVYAGSGDGMALIGVGMGGKAVTYTGPGDVVSGATAWYGLRAYNAAYATGLNKAVNVRRASDNTTQDINVTSAGALNIASANTFAGTDATCTGTIASTTLTCASASSTPHAGSTLTGAGITQPSYIVSCGTFTGGAGTCTLNAAQTVSVGETITMQYGLYVTEAYDQTGNGYNISQATAGNQPQLLPTCVNVLPCMMFTAGSNTVLSGGSLTLAQPLTFTGVDTVVTTTNPGQFIGQSATGAESLIDSNAKFSVYAGSQFYFSSTYSLNTVYSVIDVLNGASSSIVENGTAATGNAGSGGFSAVTIAMGARVPSGNLTGTIAEQGIWPSGFSSMSYGNMCHNQRLYWGTGGSC